MLLFLANGTPMLRAGDEFLQTQAGNDNPYNHDDESTWLNWKLLEVNGDIFRFVKLAIAFRKAHPSLARSRFWREDVQWFGATASVDLSETSRSLAYCLRGASQGDADLYVMINGWQEPVTFTIQEGRAVEWSRVVDTSLPSPDDFRPAGNEVPISTMTYRVAPRSIAVLMRKPFTSSTG
jgi:glycogen operon protein